ncbi:MAG: phage tail family protein [Candidatus Hydrogenedentes bacterium]|nr:phage tail family protein [Candidatus Hydrogenedentota bacterium]
MSITLGAYTFPDETVHVSEHLEEAGGRETRHIQIRGIVGGATPEAVQAELDAMLAEASESQYTLLRVRAGRQMNVRRLAFKRELEEHGPLGAFTLELESRTPLEEGVILHETSWSITASGQSVALSNAGNHTATVRIAIQATGDLVQPAVSDGANTLQYDGVVETGSELIFDGHAGSVTLDGEDALPYTRGVFPVLAPGESTLHYSDATTSSHTATASIDWRDTWW